MIKTALCWATIRHLSVVELAQVASDAGFSAITVTPGMFREATRTTSPEGLRDRLASLEIAVAAIDPLISAMPGVPEPDQVAGPFAESLGWTEELAFEAAVELGSSLVNVAQYLGETRPPSEMVDALSGLRRRAAASGLRIAVEALPESGSIATTDHALDLIAAVAAPNVGFTLDTWHHYRTAGERPALPTDSDEPPTVSMVQVSDAPAHLQGAGILPSPHDRLLPGEGAIPLAGLISPLTVRQSDLVVAVEVISAKLDALDPAVVAGWAFESIQQLLAQVEGPESPV